MLYLETELFEEHFIDGCKCHLAVLWETEIIGLYI